MFRKQIIFGIVWAFQDFITILSPWLATVHATNETQNFWISHDISIIWLLLNSTKDFLIGWLTLTLTSGQNLSMDKFWKINYLIKCMILSKYKFTNFKKFSFLSTTFKFAQFYKILGFFSLNRSSQVIEFSSRIVT